MARGNVDTDLISSPYLVLTFTYFPMFIPMKVLVSVVSNGADNETPT